MRRRRDFAVLLVICLAWASTAFGELTPGQKMAAEVLIKQFSDKLFSVRQEAVEKLVALGPDVVPLIKQTLAQTDDAEVKLRCQMVLKRIAEKYGIDDRQLEKIDESSFKPSVVTIDVKDRPFREVLQLLADESGNRSVTAAESLLDTPVTLSVKDMPYWECLDRLCRETSLIYNVNVVRGGLSLQRPEGPLDIGVCVGPVAVRIVRGDTTRRFRVPRTPAVADEHEEGLTYELAYWWEDRLPVISSRGKVIRAVAAGGAVLPADPVESVNQGGLQAGSIHAFFGEPPKDAREWVPGSKITLEGEVTLEFGVGQRIVRLNDALVGKGKRITVDGVNLDIASVNREGAAVIVTLVAVAADRRKLLSNYDGHPDYGFFLADGDGKRHAGELTRKAGDDGYMLRVSDPGAFREDWALVHVTPRTRSSQTWPFKITGIPVP